MSATSNFYDISSAIRARLAANWATTPILYENLDEGLIKTSGVMPASFVVCEIICFDNNPADIGSPDTPRYRTEGTIRLHILTPGNRGDGLGLEYADTLAAIFRGKEFSGVVCSGAGLRGGGEKADAAGNYWRMVVGVDFHYDKVFNVA